MLSLFVHRARCVWGIAVVIACGWAGLASWADEKLSEPIYRVASETPAAQTTGAAQNPASAATPATQAAAPANGNATKTVFDLTQKPGEHPLAPVVRTLKATMDEIDHNVHDYCCTFVKQERVDGELGEKQHIMLKVMNDPFSVYMSFLQPFAGREVVYVAGQNQGKMVVLDVGVKRMLGKMNLDPQGSLAMSGQKHPITDVGIRNLTAKLAKMWDGEMRFAECEVTVRSDSRADGRPATMIQVVHPVPRQDFRFNYARLFLDNEKKVPIHFDAYTWPDQAGGEPQLDESYTYTSLKLNNGYTAREFDAVNNPDIFK